MTHPRSSPQPAATDLRRNCDKSANSEPTDGDGLLRGSQRDPERLGVGDERAAVVEQRRRPAVLAALRGDLPRADHVLARRPRPAPARARSSTPARSPSPAACTRSPDGQSSAAQTNTGSARRGRPRAGEAAARTGPGRPAARTDAPARRRSRWETHARRDRARRSARRPRAPRRATAVTGSDTVGDPSRPSATTASPSSSRTTPGTVRCNGQRHAERRRQEQADLRARPDLTPRRARRRSHRCRSPADR